MTDRMLLWFLVIVFGFVDALFLGALAKDMIGGSSQVIIIDRCPAWLAPFSTCGGDDWRGPLEDADWPQH